MVKHSKVLHKIHHQIGELNGYLESMIKILTFVFRIDEENSYSKINCTT